jgi:riboflavin synthase alpha subunit
MSEYEAEAFRYVIERAKTSLKQMGFSRGWVRVNGIDFTLYPDSNIEDIAAIYNLKREIERLKNN